MVAPSPSCRALRVVGIAGPSCSGKSTVARMVAEARGATLLHLDAHWIRGCPRPLVNGALSHERPEQYDGAALAWAIARSLEKQPDTMVVVEGFLLFAYPELLDACGLRFFLDLQEEEMLARRAARSAVQGDHAAGGKREKIEQAWLANGPQEWRTYGAGQAMLPGVRRLDARLPPEETAAVILLEWAAARHRHRNR